MRSTVVNYRRTAIYGAQRSVSAETANLTEYLRFVTLETQKNVDGFTREL